MNFEGEKDYVFARFMIIGWVPLTFVFYDRENNAVL
jgi:hypothetical protein